MNERNVPEKQPTLKIATVKPVEPTNAAVSANAPTTNISIPQINTAHWNLTLFRGSKIKNGLCLWVTK